MLLSGTSLGVQALWLHASTGKAMSSIPGCGTKIPYASWPQNQNTKYKQYCNKFNKDYKWPTLKKKNFKKIKCFLKRISYVCYCLKRTQGWLLAKQIELNKNTIGVNTIKETCLGTPTVGWRNHKLESRLPGEISITSDMQMTPPLWQKVKN